MRDSWGGLRALCLMTPIAFWLHWLHRDTHGILQESLGFPWVPLGTLGDTKEGQKEPEKTQGDPTGAQQDPRGYQGDLREGARGKKERDTH